MCSDDVPPRVQTLPGPALNDDGASPGEAMGACSMSTVCAVSSRIVTWLDGGCVIGPPGGTVACGAGAK